MVPIPPMVAAIEMPSNKALLSPDLLVVNKGIRAATIIAVVAVADITIEKTIAVNMKAITMFLGFVPEIFNVSLKSCTSNLVFVIAAARKKPPSSNQTTLPEKVFTYLSIFSGAGLKYGLPSAKTRYAIKKSATAKAGIASVSHNPIEKNNKNKTYTCEAVKAGSLSNHVSPKAAINDPKK
jgi:hypothetical protein